MRSYSDGSACGRGYSCWSERPLLPRRHLHQTSPQDRARVQQLLRNHGRPARLTANERQDLLQTVRRMRPPKLVRDLVATVTGSRRGARRARR
jgi:hypothetical protein